MASYPLTCDTVSISARHSHKPRSPHQGGALQRVLTKLWSPSQAAKLTCLDPNRGGAVQNTSHRPVTGSAAALFGWCINDQWRLVDSPFLAGGWVEDGRGLHMHHPSIPIYPNQLSQTNRTARPVILAQQSGAERPPFEAKTV